MINKESILDSWIMIERLSEGDMPKGKFELLSKAEGAYHDFLSSFLQRNCTGKLRQSNGLCVYVDIFDFKNVVNILKTMYDLPPSHEDIKYKEKFGLVLYFNSSLDFESKLFFFSVGAYINWYREVPTAEEFSKFEGDMGAYLSDLFAESSKDKAKFDKAFATFFQDYELGPESCKVAFLNNLQTEATNLHSFFLQDLLKAKTVSTPNLDAYLLGNTCGHRNLDGKMDSPGYDPGPFYSLLSPNKYPFARFPSNTQFALSLMQQVAVNLSIGADESHIRSVNGPPGTGKTTLLKDIFAELVVRSSSLCLETKGQLRTKTYELPSKDGGSLTIQPLPDAISECGIVVASSNNGAVQNIVKELPLLSGIDEKLRGDLVAADYFFEISNMDVSSQWNQAAHARETSAVRREADEYWGLFSLEGGRSENMTTLLSYLELVIQDLEENYREDVNLKNQFLKQFYRVEAIRSQAQAKYYEYEITHRNMIIRNTALKDVQDMRRKNRDMYDAEMRHITESIQDMKRTWESIHLSIEENRMEKKKMEAELDAGGFVFGFSGLDLDAEMEMPTMSPQELEKKRRYREELEKAGATFRQQLEEADDTLRALVERRNKFHANYMAWEENAKKTAEKILLAMKKEAKEKACPGMKVLDMEMDYDELQLSNPWFDETYRIEQSKLFIQALKVRKAFLYKHLESLKAAREIWVNQKKYKEMDLDFDLFGMAWGWINLAIPVISSTFASFGNMCRDLGPNTIGHLFIDEAGQAVPQAGVGAIMRSRNVMAVGDPAQIKPVVTIESAILTMLGKHYAVGTKYISDSASVQTLTDAAGVYGFYRDKDKTEQSWIGIPLWVHRRCQYPMFTMSNELSYGGLMVQGMKKYGKCGWYDIKGRAVNKYVKEQGEFLVKKIEEMARENPDILDQTKKDVVYVITPFANVATKLAYELSKIGFVRGKVTKPTNIGTVHTFQGKEAPIVFMVLGADKSSFGAAKWAVSEPNMMNVAATRAKKEFYVIGDKSLYQGLGSEVIDVTSRVMEAYAKEYPDKVEGLMTPGAAPKSPESEKVEKAEYKGTLKPRARVKPDPEEEERDDPMPEEESKPLAQKAPAPQELLQRKRETQSSPGKEIPPVKAPTGKEGEDGKGRIKGKVLHVGKGSRSYYAYVLGFDKVKYTINETIFDATPDGITVIQKDKIISFIPEKGGKSPVAKEIKPS